MLIGATTVPRLASRTVSCSSVKRRNASRTGVRLTFNCLLSSSSRNQVEGGRVPSRIASRSTLVTASVVDPCVGATPSDRPRLSPLSSPGLSV